MQRPLARAAARRKRWPEVPRQSRRAVSACVGTGADRVRNDAVGYRYCLHRVAVSPCRRVAVSLWPLGTRSGGGSAKGPRVPRRGARTGWAAAPSLGLSTRGCRVAQSGGHGALQPPPHGFRVALPGERRTSLLAAVLSRGPLHGPHDAGSFDEPRPLGRRRRDGGLRGLDPPAFSRSKRRRPAGDDARLTWSGTGPAF